MLISVCIPTYSRLNYLKEAVASIQQQNYPEIEICIAQDPRPSGADINLYNWCIEQEKKGIIRYNLNAKTLGLSGNFNCLTKIAKGDYILFLGDDDLLDATFAATLAGKISSKEPDVIFCNQHFINKDRKVLPKLTDELNKKYKRNILKDGILADAIETVFQNSVPLSACLIKRALALAHPFEENINTPDLPFFLELATAGCSFYYVSSKLSYYRIHTASATDKGLTLDSLLEKIINVQVPEKYKQFKTEFIQPKIITAINMAILNGNKDLAKKLMQSEFYTSSSPKKFIQMLMLLMPAGILNLFFKVKNRFRKTNAHSIYLQQS